MDKAAVGIDVAKDTLDVVLLQGDVARHASFKNTDTGYAQLEKWVNKYQAGPVHFCLEATGQYSQGVAEYLYQHHYPVSVVNPVRIKGHGESKLRRNKTDKLDAHLIADFCLREVPPLWTPPPENVRLLQGLMRRREDLQGMLHQEQNRLKAGPLAPALQADLEGHLNELKQRIQDIERQIQAHVQNDPDLKEKVALLTSIVGVGCQTACLLLGEIPFLCDFQHVNELVAFCGLNPSQHRSGTSVHGATRMGKIGNSRIRKGLYFPAIVAMKHNPILKDFAERLLQKGKPKLCVIGAVMRKLLHLVYGILKSRQPFDPNYGRHVHIAS